MSLAPKKKLTQITLTSLFNKTPKSEPKPESSLRSKYPQPPPTAASKRASLDQASPDHTKRVKLNASNVTDCEDDPEVSSSSELHAHVSASACNISKDGPLDVFVVLKRCDGPSPKPEVSSTIDDTIESVISGKDDVDNHKSGESAANHTAKHTQEVVSLVDDDDEVYVVEETKSPSSRSRHSSLSSKAESHRSADAGDDFDSSLMDISTSSCRTPAKPTRRSKSASASKKAERDRVRAERAEEKKLKQQRKEEEKLRREKEQEEMKRQKAEKKEAERLAKQKEKEEKQRLKEEQLAKRQAEIDAKNLQKEEERKKKEEEKQKKEDEKRQKDLEKQKLEEDKLKKKEAMQNAFLKFFTTAKRPETVKSPEPQNDTWYKPFQVKTDMRLAPVCRRSPIDVAAVDEDIAAQASPAVSYLDGLRGNQGGRTSAATWPWTEDDDDITVEDTSTVCKRRVKFLQFHTDIRPAYFGTWRKQSRFVKARRPLTQDKELFDYEVDSADEWEEEEPGESVDSGDDEDEEKDEFDFDPELREDGFLVDHNYLSDDEGGLSDTEESLAAKKTKQMIARTYGKRNKKKSKLRPTVYGTVWSGEPVDENNEHHIKILEQYKAIIFGMAPIKFEAPEKKSSPLADSARRSAQQMPEEAMPELIKLLHGSSLKWGKIVKSFQDSRLERLPNSERLSKTLLRSVIIKVATYDKTRRCWVVSDDVLLKYNLSELIAKPADLLPTAAVQADTNMALDTPKLLQEAVSSPHSMSSNQKRLTEFVQKSASKKVKLSHTAEEAQRMNASILDSFDSPTKVRASSEVITLSDSDSPTGTMNKGSGVTPLPPLKPTAGSARRITFTTLAKPSPAPASVVTGVTTSPATNPQPKRVSFITLSPPAVSSPSVPTTSSSAQSTTVSPRRVAFTTLSAPPKPAVSAEVKPRRIALASLSSDDVAKRDTGTDINPV